MASLCALTLLPVNVVAAEEVAEEETPTLVSPTDENEGNLDYLTLVDSFVTAERIPTSRFDTPANVTVITADKIEANHYKSIREALYHVTGVLDGQYLNGSARTLVLIDGVKKELYPPMNMIERIEIVKGGGSALYGTDAVGGVINIITKKGATNQTTFDLSFGSWDTRNYEFSNEGINGKFHWFASGNFASREMTDIVDSNGYNIDDYDNRKFAVNISYDFTDRDSLGMYLNYYKYHFGQLWEDHQGAENGHEFSLVYDFKKGTSTPGFFKYHNGFYNAEYDNAIIANENGIWLDAPYCKRIQNLQYQNGWEFGKHKIITGLEYHRINKKSFDWNYEQRKNTNTAYYLQDTISFDDKWTLIPGVRLDHNNAFGNKWSPKLAANYRADEKTKIFASWGNVYRAPNLNELYTGGYNTAWNGKRTFEIYGNTSLNPESGHTETIGIEHNFDDNTNIRASIFNTKMKGYIDKVGNRIYYSEGYFDDDDGYGSYYHSEHYDNISVQKHRGFELDFQQKINDHFQYNVGYAFLKNTMREYDSRYFYGYAFPKNNIYLALHYANRAFKANLYGRSASGIADKDAFGNYSRTYFILDANVSYDIEDWATLYLACNNITNKNYALGDNHSLGRSFIAGAKLRF